MKKVEPGCQDTSSVVGSNASTIRSSVGNIGIKRDYGLYMYESIYQILSSLFLAHDYPYTDNTIAIKQTNVRSRG